MKRKHPPFPSPPFSVSALQMHRIIKTTGAILKESLHTRLHNAPEFPPTKSCQRKCLQFKVCIKSEWEVGKVTKIIHALM